MLRKIIIYVFTLTAMIVLFGHCAKVAGTLSGGLKDETPPKYLHSTPPNYSTNFNAKRIEMTFDEFLKLNDVNTHFVSSPPIIKKPEVLLYSKTVRVNLKEDLLPDITYSFDFGESIVDNNEGNKITGFLYVFSTGDHIDSLSFSGRVLNASDLTHRAKDDKVPTIVMLYDDLSDSAVYKHPPTYIARTDNYGFFTFSHIRPDTFLIFAIRDMGNNLMFDMPTEQIAFSDTLIITDQRYYFDPDIPYFNSLNIPDSIKEKNPGMLHNDIILYQFQEEPTKQYRTGYERKEPNMLRFSYSLPVDSLVVNIVDYEPSGKWFEIEDSQHKDTLDYWLLDTALVNRPTLMVEVQSPRTDSLNQLVYQTDTLKMTFEFPKKARERRRRRNDEPEKEKPRTAVETMLITSNISDNGTMELTDRFQLLASQPIEDIDQSKIILEELDDTLKKPVIYTLIRDSLNARKCYLDWALKEDTKYFLTVDTMSFTSLYKVNSDSTGISFSSRKKDFYSSIEISFSNIPCPLIVQVLKGDKEELVKQVTLTTGKVALLDFLKPEKYKLKVIYDRNGNGKWDTGHYLKKIQPEQVEYYTEPEIETRSNWKTELQWLLHPDKSRTKVPVLSDTQNQITPEEPSPDALTESISNDSQ